MALKVKLGKLHLQYLQYVLKNAKDGDPDHVLQTINEFCNEEQVMMNIGKAKGKILDDAFLKLKNKPIFALELGNDSGYSSIRIARLLPEDGQLVSIDTNNKSIYLTKEITNLADVDKKVDVRQGELEKYVTNLKKDMTYVDFVFIYHKVDLYLKDLKLLESNGLLKKGTCVVADIQEGIPDYKNYMSNNPKYQTKEYNVEYRDCRSYQLIRDIMMVSIYQGLIPAQQVFMDIQVDGKDIGTIQFKLFANIPKASENFKCLCTGEKGVGKVSGKPLHYKGAKFHRIIPDFMIQGGDITDGDGTGGESIYGEPFEDEQKIHKHACNGTLSMANKGPDTNQSQFFITVGCPQPTCDLLDETFVVFGKVLDEYSMEVVKKIAELGQYSGEPTKMVTISNCGLWTK